MNIYRIVGRTPRKSRRLKHPKEVGGNDDGMDSRDIRNGRMRDNGVLESDRLGGAAMKSMILSRDGLALMLGFTGLVLMALMQAISLKLS